MTPPTETPPPDPTLARRAAIARMAGLGRRLGYGLFAVAVATFAGGALRGFDGAEVVLVTACLIVGSAILAPAIVFGYAVKAASREDRRREAAMAARGAPDPPTA